MQASIEDRILRLLDEKTYGLSIEEIANALVINRSTASKYLFALESSNRIVARIMGKARLHYPKGVRI